MAAKKKTAKRTAKKKTAAKKTSSPISAAYSKSQILGTIAENTGLAKKDVGAVFESLESLVHGHVRKRGAGVFTLPGLLKIKVVRKPATKARKGINPFTGEETMFKAKPARNVAKVQALKNLKSMVND